MKIRVDLPFTNIPKGDYSIDDPRLDGTFPYDGGDMPLALFLVKAGHAVPLDGSVVELADEVRLQNGTIINNDPPALEDMTVAALKMPEYEDMTVGQLKTRYIELQGENPPSTWRKADIIAEIRAIESEE